MSRYPVLAASAVVLALTLFLTWPQALHLRTQVVPHNDAYFSMWRLGWIAHAVGTSPRHLYDANIYHQERRTLAYSDAIVLEGAVAAPLIWSGFRTVFVYNVLLLCGITLSGIAMFVLARYLTGNTSAALVSAVIFTIVPYRIEHYMHLELQWTMWVPLAFWAAHRAIEEQSWSFGLLCGVFVWFQLLSSIYYGVFLALLLAVLGVLLIASNRDRRPKSFAVLTLGGIVAGLLAVPYALPYVENARTLGPRDLGEVSTFSARWASYVTAPYQNWMWGWTADRFNGEELRLMPGVVAAALAAVGLLGRRGRVVFVYGVVCLVGIELSLGLNGHLYPALIRLVPPLRGLRAVARVSILALAALSVLAGFGIQYLQEHVATTRAREWIAASAVILLVLECGSAPIRLTEVPSATPDVYRFLQQLPAGAVVELPMSEPHWIPGFDAVYQYWSMTSWYPLVNGYSGYASAPYIEILRRMLAFPDDDSIRLLKSLNVRYVLVHQGLYDKRSQFVDLMLRMAGRTELVPLGRYRDWLSDTAVFTLQ